MVNDLVPHFPYLLSQSETGGCVLNFGPRGSSVVTIPLERLETGVEYTFNLIVWKAGRKEEATNQTVGCTPPSQCVLSFNLVFFIPSCSIPCGCEFSS